MRDLEIDLIPDRNVAAVDLFDPRHARKVLAAFGHAYGTLPARMGDLTDDQKSFLDQAISGLAQDGKVISVRLALFAEMVKGQSWTPETLRDVGGTEGVGVSFLEETFGSPQANPKHRFHQKAAQAVLKALLPQTGTDIKVQMRSESELRDASGYASQPRDFDDVIRILDPELHLITPTDPEGSVPEGQTAGRGGQRYYQLTHDYLVHSLRDWLTRKQRETRRGRAGLRLAEHAALWNAKPQNRRLPTILEWASIRTLTRPEDWTEPQLRMMRRAGRVHRLRAVGLAAVVVLTTLCLIVRNGIVEGNQAATASALVQQLLKADTAQVPGLVQAIGNYRFWTDPELRRTVAEASSDPQAKLHASLALLPVDPTQVAYLETRLRDAAPSELPVLRDALRPHFASLTPKLWSVLDMAKPDDPRLLTSASVLALYNPENPRWADLGVKVAQAVATPNPVSLRPWLEALRPVRAKLTTPLLGIVRDKQRSETEHLFATYILADFAVDVPEILAELLMVGDLKAFSSLFPVAERQAERVLPLFQAELAKRAFGKDASRAELAKEVLAERQARAAVAMVHMGKGGAVWPLLRHSPDPRLRSFIVNLLKPLGVDPKVLDAEFDHSSPRSVAIKMDDVLFDRETSIQRALILALGTYGAEELLAAERERLTAKLQGLYRNDPDAGIHGAAEWTLRRWKQQEKLKTIDAELRPIGEPGQRRWFVNCQGQTFAVVDGPVEFLMSSLETESTAVAGSEPVRRVVIPRRFAVATKEVTVEQFRRFVKANNKFTPDIDTESALKQFSPDPAGPWIGASWYTSVAYCNWLSEQEGLPKEQWCYQPNKNGLYADGMTIPADALKRKGYRLPTEAEWDYACRAGSVTSRYYGVSAELLGKYAWYQANSQEHAWPAGNLLPNDLGLFDMLGNVYEWCQDWKDATLPNTQGLYRDDVVADERVIDKKDRICRGAMYTVLSREVRSAHRAADSPKFESIYNGFRLARTCK